MTHRQKDILKYWSSALSESTGQKCIEKLVHNENVVWINVATPLDSLIFVSIGHMPNFRLLGYGEDGGLKRFHILVPE